MRMQIPKLIIDDKDQGFQRYIFNVLNNVEADLTYYDPPYGSSNELMPPSRVDTLLITISGKPFVLTTSRQL